MPTASLDLTGMASYELFLRGTLDKIGAYPDALHIGEYKTASNQMTEHTFTPAHREMAESLNRDLYEQLVKGIASGRQKTGGGGARAHRPRAVPARGRGPRRAGGRRRVRRRARRQGVARQGRVALRRARRISIGVAGLARPEQGAAHRRALRRRDHQLGGEQLRLAARRGGRVRHDRPLPAQGAGGRHRSRRSCCASTAPAVRRSRPTSSGGRWS